MLGLNVRFDLRDEDAARRFDALLAELPVLTTAVRVEEVVPTHPADLPRR
ncbi:hypothetical protein GTR00_15460, partial [Kineococcus sp. T90]|nr:hypothetical protein [Kineococcus indalonis]